MKHVVTADAVYELAIEALLLSHSIKDFTGHLEHDQLSNDLQRQIIDIATNAEYLGARLHDTALDPTDRTARRRVPSKRPRTAQRVDLPIDSLKV
jgi:hypothetical protein